MEELTVTIPRLHAFRVAWVVLASMIAAFWHGDRSITFVIVEDGKP